jgi:hypothetical protein
MLHAQFTPHATIGGVVTLAVFHDRRLKITDCSALSAPAAPTWVVDHPVAGRGVHRQAGIQTLRSGRGLEAHTAVGAAVADDAGTAAGCHLEKSLGNVPFFPVVPDDRQGFLLADPPGVVLLAVVQPEAGHLSSDRNAAGNGFAAAGDRFAGTVHDGNVTRFLKDDPGGVAKRNNLFVHTGTQVKVLLYPEYFSRIAGREHLAVVSVECHPANEAKGLEPGKVPGEVHQHHGDTNIRVVEDKIEVVVNESVNSPAVDSRQVARGRLHDVGSLLKNDC